MMKIEKPRVEPYFKGKWQKWNGVDWVLIEDWRARITTPTFDVFMHVKAGFVTDFGSLPKFYRVRVNRIGKGIVAFLPHDVGYRTHLKLINDDIRADWDWLMLEMLEWVEIGYSKRNACWIGVKTCGWKSFNEATPATIKKNKKYVKEFKVFNENAN